MPEIVMYTTRWCPFCIRARQLLERKGKVWKEIDVDASPALRGEMCERSGRNTVPQIWIGDHHVGGCDELHALDRKGTLDALFGAQS